MYLFNFLEANRPLKGFVSVEIFAFDQILKRLVFFAALGVNHGARQVRHRQQIRRHFRHRRVIFRHLGAVKQIQQGTVAG